MPTRRTAFTLLELLAVIAVIGILAAILFPGIRAARMAAGKARTRVQFSQWTAAIEAFRSEYGYYPAFHASGLVNPPGQNSDPASLHLFHDVLAAKRRDGSVLPVYASGADPQYPEAQNRKLIGFYVFSESDFSESAFLRDAFGNTEIAILVDKNLDGVVRIGGDSGDYSVLPAVGGLTPASADIPTGGIKAGVIFYAPAPAATAAMPAFLFSWK